MHYSPKGKSLLHKMIQQNYVEGWLNRGCAAEEG